MEMSWDKLADRCQLFVDTNKGLLIELLKEAEMEMARQCDLVEETQKYTMPTPAGSQNLILPQDYKRMTAVWYNGSRLHPMADVEVSLNNSNNFESGTPSHFSIQRHPHGEYLVLDRIPTSGDIKISYSSTLTGKLNANKFLCIFHSGSGFWIDTSLGSALNGLNGNSYIDGVGPTSFTNMQYELSSNNSGQKFTIESGTYPTTSAMIDIQYYRNVAPIIPGQYHKDLCDYAIAIASAKANPEMHNKHLSLWLNNIEKIKNEDADRELIHQIRSEI